MLATHDPLARGRTTPHRGVIDAAVHAFTLLANGRLEADLARYATAAELIVLPAANRHRVPPTDFDHAGSLIADAFTAARAVLAHTPGSETVAA